MLRSSTVRIQGTASSGSPLHSREAPSSAAAPEAVAEHIVDASWHTEAEVKKLEVFPEALHVKYWKDREHGFPSLEHLGLREMAFW